jgi:hypothetical protein
MNTIYIVKIQENLIEYLIDLLSPRFYEGIKSIYDISKTYSQPEQVLKNFQNFLNEISNWNNNMLENEVKRIILESKYEREVIINIIRNIIKYSLIIYSLNHVDKIEYVDNIDFDNFIWDTYKNISKEVYLNPFLFYDNLCASDVNSNIILVNSIINKNIKKSIYNLIPIKNITDYLIQLDINQIIREKTIQAIPNDSNSIELEDLFKNLNDKFKTNTDQNLEAPPIPPIIPILNPEVNQPNPTIPPEQNQVEEVKKSPENVINNDKIEKLSSSANIKQIEQELKQNIANEEQQQGGNNTDLIKKLDNDLNQNKIALINTDSDSETSSNYANNEDNINVYSNAKTSSNSGVFVGKQAISKYQNIKI